MTFLELCSKTRQECGIQGSGPSSVVSQTGILKRVVDWVADADTYIQGLHQDWDFLWAEFNTNTVIDSDSIAKPADHVLWDTESFSLLRGDSDGINLGTIPYKEWRYVVDEKTSTKPNSLCILPNNNLAFRQPADGTYDFYATYWKFNDPMSVNADEPPYAARYQRAIIVKAKMWYFADTESNSLYQEAEKEFMEIIEQMEAQYLIGMNKLSQMSPEQLIIRPI